MFDNQFKKVKVICLIVSLSFMAACNKEDVEEQEEVSPFAMTAKINGILYEMNNTFGKNEASTTTIYSYYPKEEYILLQGKPNGGPFGGNAIQMWINRNDLALGTYLIGFDTDGEDTHIDYIDNTNDDNGFIIENTASGSITITFVDEDAKRVKGTFELNVVDSDAEQDPPIFTITEGTFDYLYDVE